MLGCRIYPIPVNFDECETAENALAYLPGFASPVVSLWAGYIPSVERYTAIFDSAAAKGVYLINTPSQHQTAMEFDKFYPLLRELTPDSVIGSNLDDIEIFEKRLRRTRRISNDSKATTRARTAFARQNHRSASRQVPYAGH
jgi:hypothetical protein